ncbi:6,7-dimethyl-8-ribityllumazine synthase [Marinicella rhabdoformis]|uniref:6,7-dimethyl-8-ribityllumazine synthase n=1 Tax=Marinicella rhabdoformis TaxID=2580566 RepID=UPI0012AECCBE|nr:6,7-dimethyl-8-ribityllumazine synthase [Marinicella rhabdoformis]
MKNTNEHHVAIITAPFYKEINDGLFQGAIEALEAAGVDYERFDVPGALEVPLACQMVAESGSFNAVIALGCVIRGETAHFDHVCEQSARGIMDVSLNYGMPIGNGIITVENGDQAKARSATSGEFGKENKGKEAAEAALALLKLEETLLLDIEGATEGDED